MNIINKTLMLNKQFELKIDSYFYDKHSNKMVIIIRLRNKRYVQKIFLDDILKDKTILNSLHPVDICLIGVIYSHLEEFKKNYSIIKAPEFLELLKITPCLRITEIIYNDDNQENFIITPIFHNKKIKVTANDISHKIDIFNGIGSNDALQIGCSLKYKPVNVLNINNEIIFKTGIYFILLVASSLMITTKISFIGNFNLSGELLFLPIILTIQKLILNDKSLKRAVLFIFIGLILTWLFYLYYGFITTLPMKVSDVNSYMFNGLYYKNIYQIICYFINLMMISFLQMYLFKKNKQKLVITPPYY